MNNNSFFKTTDPQISHLIYPLEPLFWWSRRYEYPWAIQFIEESDIILDVACGQEHPFKFAVADKCKEIHAIDLEPLDYNSINHATHIQFNKTLSQDLYSKVKFKQCDASKLPYENGHFNKIFCISALEHITHDVIKLILKEFKRTLSNDGRIYLTIDYPSLEVTTALNLIHESGLVVDGEFDYDMIDVIGTEYFGYGILNCYHLVLKK